MAPELLDSTAPPEFSSDVYSFGIVLNEIIQEEEPFSDQYRNFHGRGAFAAANYARLGKRPRIDAKTPAPLRKLIERIWDPLPSKRPTFTRIGQKLQNGIEFPNTF